MMLDALAGYYDSNGIAARDFRCRHRRECAHGAPRFTTARESYVGPEYEAGTGPRLLFLSLDSGSAEGDPAQRTLIAVRQRTLRWVPGPRDTVKHWYQTHEMAWTLLRPFHPHLTVLDSRRYFAHVNSAKCCQNNVGRAKASRVLFKNCRPYIPGELKILAPDIIVTQGGEARDVITNEFRLALHERRNIAGAVYEAGVMQLTTERHALWLMTYHPNNYGKYWVQKKQCWPIYVDAVRAYMHGSGLGRLRREHQQSRGVPFKRNAP